MADFCTLCGYGDINITELYNTLVKPTIVEYIKKLKDDLKIVVGVGGVCEHCGIVSFAINDKYEAIGCYCSDEPHQFGLIDKETLELNIFENDEKYNHQRKRMEIEEGYMMLEEVVIKLYCLTNHITIEELYSDKWSEEFKLFYSKITSNFCDQNILK